MNTDAYIGQNYTLYNENKYLVMYETECLHSIQSAFSNENICFVLSIYRLHKVLSLKLLRMMLLRFPSFNYVYLYIYNSYVNGLFYEITISKLDFGIWLCF